MSAAKKRLIIGADHAGFELKTQLVAWLRSEEGGNYPVADLGTSSPDSVDYPDFAERVARAVAKGRADRGILICGTGIGMSIAANKVPGIRAALVWNPKVAKLAAEHNDANVLCLSARFSSIAKAKLMVHAFLKTPFGDGRHTRRVKKITRLEKRACG